MIIDFRYHIASLVAVFLALGIGVMIGSLVVGDGFVKSIVSEQEYIVQRLEQDYDALKNEARLSREKTAALQETVDLYQRFAREFFPYVIEGRLQGVKITVFDNADTPLPQFFLDNLRLSGAEVLRLCETEHFGTIAGQDTAPVIINNRVHDSTIARVLEKEGIKYFLVEATIPDQPATDGAEKIYYINSNDNVLEQAALIFTLAGLSG